MVRFKIKSTFVINMSDMVISEKLLGLIRNLRWNNAPSSLNVPFLWETSEQQQTFTDMQNDENTIQTLIQMLDTKDDFLYSKRSQICYLIGQCIQSEAIGWWNAYEHLLMILHSYEDSPIDISVGDLSFRKYIGGFYNHFDEKDELPALLEEFFYHDTYYSEAMAALALGKVLSIRDVPAEYTNQVDLKSMKQEILDSLGHAIKLETESGVGLMPHNLNKRTSHHHRNHVSLRIVCMNSLMELPRYLRSRFNTEWVNIATRYVFESLNWPPPPLHFVGGVLPPGTIDPEQLHVLMKAITLATYFNVEDVTDYISEVATNQRYDAYFRSQALVCLGMMLKGDNYSWSMDDPIGRYL